MYRFIAMHCGYVESCKTSLLVYNCEYSGHSGFKTMKDAIIELALDMYHKYYQEVLSIYEHRYTSGLEKCCRDALIAKHDANFCSTCGKAIKDKEFDDEGFMGFIRDLHDTDCDSYGEADSANNRALVWYPFWTDAFIGASKKSIIFIPENAESILLYALFEVKPELKGKEYTKFFDDWEKFKADEQPDYE